MIRVRYTSNFIRMYKGLDRNLKEEIKEKISLFQNKDNHQKLKVHKLQGRLADIHSFSVNYKIRIVFEFINNHTVNFLSIGSHDEVY